MFIAIHNRRDQFRVFETMISVLAQGLSMDTKVAESIEKLMNDYIELIIPGSKAKKEQEDKAFAQRTAAALNNIAALLAESPGSKIAKDALGQQYAD